MRKFNGRIIDAQTGQVIAITEDCPKGTIAARKVQELIVKMGLADVVAQGDLLEEPDPFNPDEKMTVETTHYWDVINTVI